jgi:subtilisin-like proprotein convertase family protein
MNKKTSSRQERKSDMIRRYLRRNTRLTDLRRLILLSILCVLASLAVTASPSAATSFFSNPTPIEIPDSGAIPDNPQQAKPYPSEIAVSGLVGPITDVNVTLQGVGHKWPDDIEALLVSPSGDDVMLMSDACGEDDIEDYTWTFSDQAPGPMSDDSADCGASVYRPTNHVDAFDTNMESPAPPGPYGTSLASFNNENPNGTWRLYVEDDVFLANAGDIELGWTIAIETGPVDMAIPVTSPNFSASSGPASPYPATRTISGVAGGITDLNVSIDGIWHQSPDDLDLLLVGPQGQKVILMSDACGSLSVSNFGWEWDDEAATPMPEGNGTNVCGTRFHRPANYGSGDLWPAPAPAGPYSTSLSAFDFTNPNGEWSLFVNDDEVGGTGFFTNRFQLQITTDATAPRVTSVLPANNATGVGAAANVSATFSEAMRATSINTNSVKIFKVGTTNAIGAVVSYDATANKATLNPNNNLRRGTKYKAVVTTGTMDLAGNQLDQNPSVTGGQQKVWFFKARN